jgi:hypothetical protein
MARAHLYRSLLLNQLLVRIMKQFKLIVFVFVSSFVNKRVRMRHKLNPTLTQIINHILSDING